MSKPWEESGYDFIEVYVRKIGKTGGKSLVVEYEIDGDELCLRGIYDGEPEDGLNWLIANRITLDEVSKAVEAALKERGEEAFAADAYHAMRSAA